MVKSLKLRCVVAFLALDATFAPLAGYAYAALLSVQPVGTGVGVITAVCVVKAATWLVYLLRALDPAERFREALPTSRSDRLIRQADRALQDVPLRFGIFYAVGWALALTVATLILAWSGDLVTMGIRSVLVSGLVVTAVLIGSFVFAPPLMGVLTSDAAGECSVAAASRGIDLERAPTSLRARIGVSAMCLALAPLLWMMALGYGKQVESARAQNETTSQLEASRVALAVQRAVDQAGGAELTPTMVERIVGEGLPSGMTAIVLTRTGQVVSGPDGERLLTGNPALKAWVLRTQETMPHGSLTRSETTTAFERVGERYVALIVWTVSSSASPSFLISAIAFACVITIWAPLCAWFISRAVSQPIQSLTETARRVVERGDLSQIGRIPVAQYDEVGVLAERFNDVLDLLRGLGAASSAIAKGDLRADVKGIGEIPETFRGMIESLRDIVRQIRETSLDLARAASEIFAASQEQEAAASSQSSAMAEISGTMDTLSRSAGHVTEAVQGVLSNAERTLKNTDDMVARIGELSTHAGRIGEILEVIRDIANRSDLLALNGSLEASRAGEGGRGFGLVANEMRRLAERVTASVQDVKELVSDIRDSGSGTVMATEESRKLAEGTTDAARQITFVTHQQKSGTDQVSSSIKDMADVIAQAVAATSQTRIAAEGLKTQADRLGDLVRRFEIAGGAHVLSDPRVLEAQ